ncbi:hypothetical protein Pan181_44850 [Aeoliella mucimassa]|uniref:Uncharacterized protein n=1 Tax=Aeoliella mucimassa TaxID=2527972 RepID=A0A518AU53_9BACT|nr:hypothetical protein Pan181_44850 [Aeoliella mucimassa]
MQLVSYQRLAIDSHCENRFPLEAFWEMRIYSGAKTTGFVEWAIIQFSHRWVNWESILKRAYHKIDSKTAGCIPRFGGTRNLQLANGRAYARSSSSMSDDSESSGATVSRRGPLSVTAIVCSKWALGRPSAVTWVQ